MPCTIFGDIFPPAHLVGQRTSACHCIGAGTLSRHFVLVSPLNSTLLQLLCTPVKTWSVRRLHVWTVNNTLLYGTELVAQAPVSHTVYPTSLLLLFDVLF